MKLPTDLSGQELVRLLGKVGFVVNRQKGSHVILRRPGTLRQILNEAGMSVEQLIHLR